MRVDRGDRDPTVPPGSPSACGVPRAIVRDDGRDWHRGLTLYGAEHRGTCWIYDIRHQTAALLKRTRERDSAWTSSQAQHDGLCIVQMGGPDALVFVRYFST